MPARNPSFRFEAQDFTHRFEVVNGFEVDPLTLAAPSEFPRELLTEADAARHLAIPLSTLKSHRKRGTGPAPSQYMGAPAYDVADLDAWAAARRAPSQPSSTQRPHAD